MNPAALGRNLQCEGFSAPFPQVKHLTQVLESPVVSMGMYRMRVLVYETTVPCPIGFLVS